MIKTRLRILAACVIALPVTGISAEKPESFLPSKNGSKNPPTTMDLTAGGTQPLATARQSVRFAGDALTRAKHANDPDYSVALYPSLRQVPGKADGLSRGSGLRARQRSL